jgi:hypothetical protein
MNIQSIPRYSLPARLICIDLISRLESSKHKTNDMRHSVTIVTRYLIEPSSVISEEEFLNCLNVVEKLYST